MFVSFRQVSWAAWKRWLLDRFGIHEDNEEEEDDEEEQEMIDREIQRKEVEAYNSEENRWLEEQDRKMHSRLNERD